MLKDMGYHVTGSDNNIYPPMSRFLEERGFPVMAGFDRRPIVSHRPDLVVVGNAVSRDNAEVVATGEMALVLLFHASGGQSFCRRRQAPAAGGRNAR
jgi:UDP-N-acetylmuramate: L-alanyl-gamma-D-glutamyl-meso-diaminopimelate ligase